MSQEEDKSSSIYMSSRDSYDFYSEKDSEWLQRMDSDNSLNDREDTTESYHHGGMSDDKFEQIRQQMHSQMKSNPEEQSSFSDSRQFSRAVSHLPDTPSHDQCSRPPTVPSLSSLDPEEKKKNLILQFELKSRMKDISQKMSK